MGSSYERRRALGEHGENLAVEFLECQGWEIVSRNWRCRWGELDIVARDAETLVFCEVKTRRSLAYGTPLEAVTAQKVARLRRLVGLYLADQEVRPSKIRIDVLAVLVPRRGPAELTHVKAVA